MERWKVEKKENCGFWSYMKLSTLLHHHYNPVMYVNCTLLHHTHIRNSLWCYAHSEWGNGKIKRTEILCPWLQFNNATRTWLLWLFPHHVHLEILYSSSVITTHRAGESKATDKMINKKLQASYWETKNIANVIRLVSNGERSWSLYSTTLYSISCSQNLLIYFYSLFQKNILCTSNLDIWSCICFRLLVLFRALF